ncbi:MAG: hypothetical protein ACRESW_03925, partial [Nevskiales bacterium]
MYRRYLLILSLLLLPCLPPLVASYLYLRNSGELQTMEQMGEVQSSRQDFCLVGPTLHEDFYHYKLALYRARKPDVVVIGSSRVLQFRENYFRDRFLNMGSSMREIATGEHLLHAMLQTHKPKLVILGVDYWWFNEQVEEPGARPPPVKRSPKVDFGQLMQPWIWLREGKIGREDFFNRLNPLYRAKGLCRIGVRARTDDSGFGPDGSNYSGALVTGRKNNFLDRQFEITLDAVREGDSRWKHGSVANDDHVRMFVALVQAFREQGIEVLLFLPPLAPSVVTAMSGLGNSYAYIDDMRHKLTAAGLTVFNFHDPRAIGSSDCEFIDGSHGGDI